MLGSRSSAVIAVSIVFATSIAGCLSETAQPPPGTGGSQADLGAENRTWLPTDPGRLQLVATADMIGTPAETAEVEGHLALDAERELVLAGTAAGLLIYDISDPTAPTRVGHLGSIHAHDVVVKHLPDRTVAVVSSLANGTKVVDVTDPAEPSLIFKDPDLDVDNLGDIPDTSLLYVGIVSSPQDPQVGLLDLSMPENPDYTTFPIPDRVGGEPTMTDGCHSFDVRRDLGLVACAAGGSMFYTGGGETLIWRTDDGFADPTWVTQVDHPAIQHHHSARFSAAGHLLFVGGENWGFANPVRGPADGPELPRHRVGAQNCQGTDAQGTSARAPTGAVWVFDVSDVEKPARGGYVQPATEGVEEKCSAHFGATLHEDHVVWSWYDGGTLLIDASDPADPRIDDREPPANSTMDVVHHRGYVFASSGDLQVLQVQPEGD